MDTAPVHPIARQQIIGRKREQAQLRGFLTEALGGHGQVVLIGGEAGIGKTTLVRDLVTQAEALGALVLGGGCYDLSSTPPYGLWIEALRAYRPAPGQPPRAPWFDNLEELERGGGQAALLEDARLFFAAVATQQPLVIVLEDLHWADPASLEALRYLGRYIGASALLIVATFRIDELEGSHALVRQLPHLVRESQVRRMQLRRLDRDEIQALIAAHYDLDAGDLPRLVTHIWERSSGNPFFAREMLHGLEEERLLRLEGERWALDDLQSAPVPALLLQILDARLARLAPQAQAALRVAAVLGQTLPIELWRAVAGFEAAQFDRVIEEALASRLLEPGLDVESLRFRHALFREALYGTLLPGRRRELHRLSAEAILATPNPDPDEVAHHYRRAGDQRELEWVVRAGLRARRSAAFITAIERFERAAALLDGDPARVRERAWLLFYAVWLSRYHGELRPESLLDEAERMAALAGDRVLLTSIQFHRGLRCSLQGQARKGLQEFRAAVRAFEELNGTERVAHVDVLAPAVLRSLVHPTAAQADAGTATTSELGARPTPLFARCILATWLTFTGHYGEALEVGEAIVAEMVAAFGEDHLRSIPGASGHFALGQAYAVTGRIAEARHEFGLARRGYELIGDASMADVCVWSDLLLTVLTFQSSDLAERARLAADSERIRSRNVSLAPAADLESPGVAVVNFLEGRWAEARAQAENLRSAYALPMVQSGIALLGVVARSMGEPEVAWEQIAALHPEGPRTEPGDSYFPAAHAAQRLAAELALDAGDPDLARQWLDAHARWLDWSGATLWQGEQLLLEARYQRAMGALDAARSRAEAAWRYASDPRQPLLLGAVRRELGILTIRAGQLEQAREHLAAALELALVCAAPFERALTLVELIKLADATDDTAEARRLYAEAREIGLRLNAPPLLERIDRFAPLLDDPPPVAPDGLTARELEILRLVAIGESNVQIADTLRLSARTVERHVANIYRKIDVHNRAGATAYALSKRLV